MTTSLLANLLFSTHLYFYCTHKLRLSSNYIKTCSLWNWSIGQPASPQMGSHLLLYISVVIVMIILTETRPCYHHPQSSQFNSQVGCMCTQRTILRPAALRDAIWALGSRLWPAGRKQKPEEWWNRLGEITHCCLYLRPVCAGCWWVNRGDSGA